MNVGQGTWDSIQLKTVVPLKRRWIFSLRAVVNAELVRMVFWVCELPSGDFVPLTLFLGHAKGAEVCHNCLTKDWEKPGGECSYTARSEPKELSYRATLCWPFHPQKGSTLSSSGLIAIFLLFYNSLLRWRCHCLSRRYFSCAPLVLSLKSFPLSLILICFIVN